MARTVKVDMTGVETYTKASEGIHTAKVSEIEDKVSQGGDQMLQFTFEIIKGEDKGCKVFDNFVLTDKALWKLKSFLQAIGMKADGKLKIDLDKLIGKTCDIEVFWDEYNGQTRSKISDYFKAGKKNAASTDDEDDEDEEDTVDDDDEDEEEEPAPKKAKGKKRGPKPKKKPEPEPDDEDDEEDDDTDDEEEPEPPKKRGRKPKAEKKPVKAKKPDPDDEDDEDWEDDDDEWEEE